MVQRCRCEVEEQSRAEQKQSTSRSRSEAPIAAVRAVIGAATAMATAAACRRCCASVGGDGDAVYTAARRSQTLGGNVPGGKGCPWRALCGAHSDITVVLSTSQRSGVRRVWNGWNAAMQKDARLQISSEAQQGDTRYACHKDGG